MVQSSNCRTQLLPTELREREQTEPPSLRVRYLWGGCDYTGTLLVTEVLRECTGPRGWGLQVVL